MFNSGPAVSLLRHDVLEFGLLFVSVPRFTWLPLHVLDELLRLVQHFVYFGSVLLEEHNHELVGLL